jgi:hypothetical protein
VKHTETAQPRSRVTRIRERNWTKAQRITVVAAIAIVMGCLFLTSYSLALGDPVPHKINAALIGDRAAGVRSVDAVEQVTDDKLVFRPYNSVAAARNALDQQRIYAALDVTSARPTLYVASAAGTSVARVLERIYAVDPAVQVVDSDPVASDDPNGLDLFYLLLVTTIVGFVTVFQVRAQVDGLQHRDHVTFVLGLAVVGSLVLALVDGPLLGRPAGLYPEESGILALQLLAVASFTSLMIELIGRWAILPTWLFFVILGNASSGGAVAPALLPQPFAFVSQWLPSGATVTALRNAIYFRGYQHLRPFAVLAVWAAGLFIAWLTVAHQHASSRRGTTQRRRTVL